MTQEQKDLLLKDLCARLPYGVIGQCEIDASYDTSFDTIFQTHKFDAIVYGIKEDLLLVTPLIEDKDEQEFANEEVADGVDILDFKPYLRPMSSMTEEELEELKTLCSIYIPTDSPTIGFEDYGVVVFTHHLTNNTYSFKLDISVIDWLNKKMFDYRGLIPMKLTKDVTGLNIYTNYDTTNI